MRACRRASLTIEAAASLPLFAIALLAIVSIIPMQRQAMDLTQEVFLSAAEEAMLSTEGREYISISEEREFVPLTDFFGMISVKCRRNCLAHAWCGYENDYFADEEFVYVTRQSEVYHKDRLCSHLKLTVTETSSDEVRFLRNDSGSRYKSCNICHSRLSDNILYITPDGDRYHNSITCSGLKRTVFAIRKSETGDRRQCSRCGR